MNDGTTTAESFYGRTAFDRDGTEMGTVDGVYVDRETQEPTWAAVRVGADRLALVPLAGAALDGDGLRLAFDERLVRGAPGDASVRGDLPRELEAELYHYYSLDYAAAGPDVMPEGRLPSGPADAT